MLNLTLGISQARTSQQINPEFGGFTFVLLVEWLSKWRKDPKFMLDFCLANQIETIFIIPDRIWDIENEIKRESNLKNLYMITQECQEICTYICWDRAE